MPKNTKNVLESGSSKSEIKKFERLNCSFISTTNKLTELALAVEYTTYDKWNRRYYGHCRPRNINYTLSNGYKNKNSAIIIYNKPHDSATIRQHSYTGSGRVRGIMLSAKSLLSITDMNLINRVNRNTSRGLGLSIMNSYIRPIVSTYKRIQDYNSKTPFFHVDTENSRFREKAAVNPKISKAQFIRGKTLKKSESR